MQKAYPDVIKHILDFLNGDELVTSYDINKNFRETIRGDVRYAYRYVHSNWIKNIRERVLEEGEEYLDISKRNNGDIVFFVPDLRLQSGIVMDPYFAEFISDNSHLFVEAGGNLNWEIDDDKKFSRSDVLMACGRLYYKHIVGPCRVHNLGDINVLAIQLHYFPYLKFSYKEPNPHIFQVYVKYKIENDRHPFLRSDKDRKLELDGYNNELSLAFEHSGLQHFENIEFFSRDSSSYERLKENDKIKADGCRENKITLIVIPSMKHENYLKFIYDQIKICAVENKKIMDLLPKECPSVSKVEIDKMLMEIQTQMSQKKFDEMKKSIEDRGGVIVDEKTKYISATAEFEVKCRNDHVFNTNWKKVMRTSMYLCPSCATNPERVEDMNQIMIQSVTAKGCKVLKLSSMKNGKELILYEEGKYFTPEGWHLNLGRIITYVCPKGHAPITVRTGNFDGFRTAIIATHRGCIDCKNGK